MLASGGGAAQVWEAVNALAARPGMINMGQGFPDFEGSAVARRVAADAVAAGDAASNQYSPQPGLLRLRESISAFYQRSYGAGYDPSSEIVVTAGGQESLAAAFLAFLDPGDEVVLFEPFYPFMLGAIQLAGAVPRVVTLRSPDFAIDEGAVREACSSPRARMLVLNTPHNPTGHVANEAELSMIARLCLEHDLLAVADEVYCRQCSTSTVPSTVPSVSPSTVLSAVISAILITVPITLSSTVPSTVHCTQCCTVYPVLYRAQCCTQCCTQYYTHSLVPTTARRSTSIASSMVATKGWLTSTACASARSPSRAVASSLRSRAGASHGRLARGVWILDCQVTPLYSDGANDWTVLAGDCRLDGTLTVY